MNSSPDDFFSHPDNMLILTTSPAGLGHIRVTEALRSGLDPHAHIDIVGIRNPSIQFLHRATSQNRYLRHLMEFVQTSPLAETQFTYLYQKHLSQHAHEVYQRISDLVKRRRPKPQTLIIVSTHFSLAHQIAAIKNQLSQDLDLCIVLVVIVTDDSPSKIWAISQADFIFVPSQQTQERLNHHLTQAEPKPQVIVNPYPIDRRLCQPLTEQEYQYRQQQLHPHTPTPTQIIIPISGAAVQLDYSQQLITGLERHSQTDITVVSRESKYTTRFLNWCQDRPSVNLIANQLDRDVVADYQQAFQNQIFALEITKPSEQTFKTLLSPRQRGGVIMLFSPPVGQQENDNLAFLYRHLLLPDYQDKIIIDRLFVYHETLNINKKFLATAQTWRGILLPSNGPAAATAIFRLKDSGILSALSKFSQFPNHPELKDNGVNQFWSILAQQTAKKCHHNLTPWKAQAP